jgi:hypothetical protein
MSSRLADRGSPPERSSDNDNMDLFEVNTHPFIIKIWLEESAQEAGQATWRGHITHVPTGERRYLRRLDDILAFIIPYMKEMGVKLGLLWRVKRWLKR